MAKSFICTDTTPIVETTSGKLRGMIVDGMYEFFGVQYAVSKRFGMPEAVPAWEGVKDATCYGYVCPLLQQDKPGPGEVMVPHRYWPMDENCQNLNVWTKSLTGKKPVMFWIHGGGYAAGSSIEQMAYDGFNLAEFGDVVVVSVNHRLNILGYLDLSPFGEKYKNSGNAGHADLVAALQWVHDNIASFGGDPDNVTIFGQSGGGGKCTMLLQTPKAAGLFHKAIIMSGIMERPGPAPEKNNGKRIVEELLKELKLSNVAQLETVPYHDLALAYNKVADKVRAEGWYVGANSSVDDDLHVGYPVTVGFTDHAKQVSVMVGSCLCEFSAFRSKSAKSGQLTDEEALALISSVHGSDKAPALIEEFKKAYPGKRIQDLADIDTIMRMPGRHYIDRRIADGCAPTYSYLFTLDFDFRGGTGAWHCSDIPFVFHNTDKVPVALIDGVTEKLEQEMFGAWVAFARTGDPNHDNLPAWKPCTAEAENVMVFDRVTRSVDNVDHALYALLPEGFIMKPPADAQH